MTAKYANNVLNSIQPLVNERKETKQVTKKMLR